MPRLIAIAVSILALGALLASACGGSSKKDATATPAAASPAPAKTAAATPTAKTLGAGAGSPATGATSAATSAAAAATPVDSAPPPSGTTYTLTQAKTLLDDASLKPADLGVEWNITMDQPTDNAAAAAADPASAASIERCGRLAGRLIANGPKDTVSAYLGGAIVAAFSQLTVYATAAGAADCAAEAAVRFQKPGELPRAFGKVFINPDAVVVKPVDYPQIGNGSFATALTGDINAAGTVAQLQIVIVAFLKGNVTAVVGVAYAPLSTPSTKELTPLVDLVLRRITANQ